MKRKVGKYDEERLIVMQPKRSVKEIVLVFGFRSA